LPFDVETEWKDHLSIEGQVWQLGVTRGNLRDFLPLSDDFSLIFGDAVHNFWAALDHLTWQLVKMHGTIRLGRKKAEGVYFPFHKTAKVFEDMKALRTPGVPNKPDRALMKRYQPYRRGDGPEAIRWLHFLAVRDKHRVVTPSMIALVRSRSEYEVSEDVAILGAKDLLPVGKTLELGAPVAKIYVVARPEIARREVTMKCDLEVFPVVSGVAGRAPAQGVLNAASATVRDILEQFEALY